VFNGVIINKIIKITDNPRHIQTFCVAFVNSITIRVGLVVDKEVIVKI
jgi:hypothetical protein